MQVQCSSVDEMEVRSAGEERGTGDWMTGSGEVDGIAGVQRSNTAMDSRPILSSIPLSSVSASTNPTAQCWREVRLAMYGMNINVLYYDVTIARISYEAVPCDVLLFASMLLPHVSPHHLPLHHLTTLFTRATKQPILCTVSPTLTCSHQQRAIQAFH